MGPAEIASRLARVREEVAEAARQSGRDPAEVRLIAVTKRVDTARIAAAIEAGQRDFGENYVQEALGKIEQFGPDVRWHMIGQLQSNKAARAARFFFMIHSLASLSAARAISRAMAAEGRQARVLVQIHLGGGPARGGVPAEAAEDFVRQVTGMPGILVDGVMGIAPLGEPPRPHFARLREMLERLRELELPNAPLRELSAGMSGDFRDAIAEGATMVRIGEAIFGPRI
ncbi:MAG: YggS family pyridoxal phosphate-dependent enzyme [Candidatus Dadabacteria bacterium]|nr:MAG: YggS family pyridoxal phosphate-dependent enzyme [Candidatus Dadabacteria bacterium]